MATPANRVPVRIARGSKANLDTAIAAGDLKEGEVCYATDENGIYVVEGGVLTQAGADLASTSIDALSDVDTTTAAPTDGQVLIWNNVDGEWQPGDLPIDALSDVDTTTAAPADGQALVWNNSASQWEPGGVSGEIEWTLTANGTTDYIFSGTGFAGTETDPDLYVVRGQTYKFTNGMGAHPFQIQSTQGASGTAYSDGITNNAVSDGTLTWEVRMDAPSTLYYQCTSHADMNGTIYVLDEGGAGGATAIDDLSDVDTSTVAPTDGQALVWDNANSKWEPGTVSGGGTTLPSANDGEALIYENGQWVAGPAIGGVDYTLSNADANYSDVGLLMLANGTNASTTFTDSSSNSFTLTAGGDAQISTAQSKFGGASAYLPSTSSYEGSISTPSSSDLAMGTGDFTVECWYRPISIGNTNPRIWSFGATDWHSNDVFILHDRASGNNTKVSVVVYSFSTSPILVSSTSISDGTWYHLAVVRNGSTFKLFVDGVEEASYVNANSVSSSSSIPLVIGARNQSSAINGYIDDFRVTKGVARYTSNFTPPTAELPTTGGTVTIPYSIDKLDDVDTSTVAPTDGQALVWDNANSKWEPGTVSGGGGTTLPSAADGAALIYENGQWISGPVIGGVSYTSAADPEYSNVQLLLHCNGTNGSTTFTDSSQNGLSVTANGNSQISTAQYKFGGASAYFDGASNGIQVANSALITGTGQFTIEMWFYALNLDGGLAQSQQFNGGYELGLYTSGLKFWTYNGSNVLTTTAPSTNAWHHVAVTRDASNTLRMFVDGVLADSATNFTENLYRNILIIGTSRTNFYDFDGYIDDFRLTTGVARYTAAFTPPTAQHLGAGSPVTIPYSIDKLDDVDTSTVAPTDGQVLTWDNTAQKWEPGTVSGGGGATTIDGLTDVDTSTVAPTDGQALVWDNANSKWEPGTVSGGGAVSSVNTLTGAVSLGVEDLDDFELNTSSLNSVTRILDTGSSSTAASGYVGASLISSGLTYWPFAPEGSTATNVLTFLRDNTSWPVDVDINGTTVTVQAVVTSGTSWIRLQHDGLTDEANITGTNWTLSYSSSSTVPLADGDILQYNSTDSKFKPAQLGVDDLSDVDTSTVAPTDGQALVWDNANSKWEPGTVSGGGGGTTLPSGTTDGEALIWENGAWAVGPAIGGVDYFQGSTISSNYTAPTGFSYWVDTFSLRDPSNATLSNNDLTATCGSSETQAYSNSSKSSGLWYWEISVDGGTDNNAWFGMGVNVNYWVGSSNSGGISINGSGQIANNTGGTTISSVSSHVAGDIRMFALDADNKKLWIGKNGTWENSGDPVAGTGEVLNNWSGTPDWLFICRLENTNSGWGNTIQITGSPGTQITIPYSIDKLDDVDTSTVAPTDGQALLWDNTAQKWEPGTVSGGGGTSLPAAQDGEALIYENGQWVAGPVIGGVDYTTSAGAQITTYTIPTGFSHWNDVFLLSPSSRGTLSNNDLISTQTSTGELNSYSSTTKSSGKWYWEIEATTLNNDGVFGIVQNPTGGSFPGGGTSGGIGIKEDGTWWSGAAPSGTTVTNVSSTSNGDILMFALDADASKLWFGRNGTWDNSGDPAAGTGDIARGWSNTLAWYFVVRGYSVGTTYEKQNYISTTSTNTVIPYSIDKLDDVDTSTVAPTDGQSLVWNASNSRWEPATVSGGGGSGITRAQATAITLLFS